jgi:hypothetical protein
MAIDATISTRGTDDQYDLDIIAALAVAPDDPPDSVFDLLSRSVEDYPTSLKVIRQTRCVTIRYADRMHLDLTPAARLPNGAERESHVFHANPAEPSRLHFHVPMNAYGFGLWYQSRTPQELRFGYAFDERFRKAYGYEIRADAEVDDVPAQVPINLKSVTTVALQLLKRFRNVAYGKTEGRIPPSVMISCFAGHAAQPGLLLSDMVIRQARMIASAIRQASARRVKIMVVNPVFQRDCFTDRWPEDLSQQEEFAAKLTDLADGLEYFKRQESDLETLQNWLRKNSAAPSFQARSRDSTRAMARRCRTVRSPTHNGAAYMSPARQPSWASDRWQQQAEPQQQLLIHSGENGVDRTSNHSDADCGDTRRMAFFCCGSCR